MKKLKFVAAFAILVMASMFGFAVLNDDVHAACSCPIEGQTCQSSVAECGVGAVDTNKSDGKTLMKTVQTVINVVLSVVGVIAVAVIILGGISFITSQGDTSKVTKARNTILYGVVGLVVALLSFAIVNFVLKNVFNGSNSGTSQEQGGEGEGDETP